MSDQDALNAGKQQISANIDSICDRFEVAYRAGEQPCIEELLPGADGAERDVLLFQLILLELEYRSQRGEETGQEEYLARFTDDRSVVGDAFKAFAGDDDTITRYGPRSAHQAAQTKRQSTTLRVRCPHCHNPVEVAVEGSFESVQCDACGSQFSLLSEISETRDPAEIETLGHFELIEWLGAGGFGTVWKARDTQLDRIVAVKIPSKGQLSAEEQEKFLREARAAAQLKHPNIVSIHEIGRAGDTVYIVSDMVRGVSLSDWLSAKQINARESAELCVKIADALEHSHQAGVVHRDLKPKNIMIDAAGEPHVTDFGLARREFGEVTMTVEGQVLGTPAYMPPEQASGEGHRADNRADIYSLGVILYRLLTGELPFRGNARMLIQQVLHDEPPSPRKLNSTIPRDLATVCLKCLEKDPSKRYQRAKEVADELQRFLRNEPIRARPLGNAARTWRWCKRNPSVAGLLGAVGCTLLAGCLVSWYFGWQANHNATMAQENAIAKTIALAKLVVDQRFEGYRQQVQDHISDALRFGGKAVDKDPLRKLAVSAMGDFVGLSPIEYSDFQFDVTAMGVHPKGKLIAVGLKNGEIRLVKPLDKTFDDSAGGLPRHSSSIVGLEFSATADRLISVDSEGTVLFCDYTPRGGWEESDELKVDAGEDGVESVQLTPGQKQLLTRNESVVALWDLTGRPTQTSIWRHSLVGLGVEGAVVSPDGRLIAIGYSSGPSGFIIKGPGGSEREYPVDLGNPQTHSMTFSPDGKFFVYGAEQGLAVYQVEESKSESVPEFEKQYLLPSDVVRAVAFSHDSKFLASIDIHGGVTVWSVAKSKMENIGTLSHLRNRPWFQFLAFSADESYLASANLDSVKVWNLATRERTVFEGHAEAIPSVTFSPDGESFATGSKDGTVRIWDSEGMKRPLILERTEFSGSVQCVAFSADGRLLATADAHEHAKLIPTVKIWDVTKNEVKLIDATDHDHGAVTRLVFIGNGRLAATAMLNDDEGGVMVWDVRNDAGEIDFETTLSHQAGARSLCVTASSDGKLLAWSTDTQIRVWDLEADKEVQIHAPPMLSGWHGLEFFPDTKSLIFVSSEREAVIWDIEYDKLLGSLASPDQFLKSHIAVSEDGRWFAGVIGESAAVGIWDMETQEHQFSLRPERADIWSLAWSPDATRLALGLSDGGLTVWNLTSVTEQLAELGLWSDVKATD